MISLSIGLFNDLLCNSLFIFEILSLFSSLFIEICPGVAIALEFSFLFLYILVKKKPKPTTKIKIKLLTIPPVIEAATISLYEGFCEFTGDDSSAFAADDGDGVAIGGVVVPAGDFADVVPAGVPPL